MSIKILKLIFCIIIMSFANSMFAQSYEFTIEGEIHFQNTGNICVYLVTEDIFKEPFTGVQDSVIKIGQDEIDKKKVTFKFIGIQPGIYGIRCFQDVNGNGKLDKGMFGPKEPWGMSWQGEKPAKWPKFEHIAFEVKSDITDVKIDLK